MERSIGKINCGKCNSKVDLMTFPMCVIFDEGRSLGRDDSHRYSCEDCGNRVIFSTEKLDLWEKTRSKEFEEWVREEYSETLSTSALDVLIYLCGIVEAPYYICTYDGKSRIDGFIMRWFNLDEKELKSIIDSLWRKRLVMRVGVDHDNIYLINGVYLGLEEDEKEFSRKGMYLYNFFTKPCKSSEATSKRNARMSFLLNDFTNEQSSELLSRFGGKCALTGKDVNLHMDHVIPVSIGHGGTTLPNMLPIWQRINSSKGNRNLFEWYKANGERFEVCPTRFKEVIEYLADLNSMSVSEYREYVYECHENPIDYLAEKTI